MSKFPIILLAILVMAVAISGCTSFVTKSTPTDAFDQRTAQAGAASGDPQITLIWDNLDDLDLHCITPSGDEIFYDNPEADNGTLDVDANSHSSTPTTTPVENIYWQPGTAPHGHYIVSVVYFSNNEATVPCDYSVRVVIDGKSQVYHGTLQNEGDNQTVCEFDL